MAYSTVTFNGGQPVGQPANITFVALHSIDTAPWQFVDIGDVSGRLRQDTTRDALQKRQAGKVLKKKERSRISITARFTKRRRRASGVTEALDRSILLAYWRARPCYEHSKLRRDGKRFYDSPRTSTLTATGPPMHILWSN